MAIDHELAIAKTWWHIIIIRDMTGSVKNKFICPLHSIPQLFTT